MNTHYKWPITSGIALLAIVLLYNAGNLIETSSPATSTVTKNLATTTQSQSQVLVQESVPTSTKTSSPFQDFNTNPPKYLFDTELRGQLTTLADGSLFITDEIRKRFDYFYMMTGDRSQQDINAIIVDHIRQQLSQPAQNQALDLLQKYTDYLNEYATFSQGLDIQIMQDDPQWVASEIRNMRNYHLGEDTSDIFFSQQEILRSNYLQQENNPLSAQILENQSKTLRLTNLQQQTATLKAENADNEIIHNLRVELVGEEAANRLTQLDADRRNWQEKKQAYKVLKAQWNEASGLSNNDKISVFEKQAIENLALTESELKRLKALDYIQSRSSS
ncbi:MAG: lipase secretion chaperone [Oleispira sp.]